MAQFTIALCISFPSKNKGKGLALKKLLFPKKVDGLNYP
jgi:hypothetical protein